MYLRFRCFITVTCYCWNGLRLAIFLISCKSSFDYGYQHAADLYCGNSISKKVEVPDQYCIVDHQFIIEN
jgi:hypothetical protein